MSDYETVLCIKPEVFVYRIPPRTSTRGYRASDWNLANPDWTGRLRITAKGKQCFLKLEDKTSGDLFAQCPVDDFPGVAVEGVLDSSRYFVVKIVDTSGKHAFIGIGFGDRGDAFDMNVSLQDHFKWVKTSDKLKQDEQQWASQPSKDYSLKQGQTITIKLGDKMSTPSSQAPKPVSATGSLLPPPPGGSAIPTLAPPTGATAASPQQQQQQGMPLDPFGSTVFGSTQPSVPQSQSQGGSDWGEFTSTTGAGSSDWVKF